MQRNVKTKLDFKTEAEAEADADFMTISICILLKRQGRFGTSTWLCTLIKWQHKLRNVGHKNI